MVGNPIFPCNPSHISNPVILLTVTNSYRAILHSSVLMGAASVVNIVAGLVRMKVAAMLLGPAGVGLIGLFQSLVGVASTLGSLGFREAGTRQVAAAQGTGEHSALAAARRALFWGTLTLAFVAGVGFFLLRDLIANTVVDDPLRASEVGWLALGVVLTVGAGSQQALLNGLRRIGDLARMTMATGVLSAIIGVAALLIWRERAIVIFVIGSPLASFLVGHWYVSKLGPIGTGSTPLRELTGQWSMLGRLGAIVMLSALTVSLGHLLVRTLLQRDIGSEALGLFTAAWLISQYYIGFLYAAITTDYYPRLTANFQDKVATNRLVNEQTEVGLLVAGPLFLGMVALAPVAIRFLYTSEFAESTSVLRWLVLGDVLKTAAHPLGFALLAASAGRSYLLLRFVGTFVFVAGTWVLLPLVGVSGTGMAYVIMYAVYLPLVFCLVHLVTGLSWTRSVRRLITALIALAVAITLLAEVSEMAAGGTGVVVVLAWGVYALTRLGSKANLGGGLGRLTKLGQRFTAGFGARFP
jgi:O-antigen/teichoic acid export membrane protein